MTEKFVVPNIDDDLLKLATPAELDAYREALEEEVYLASPATFGNHIDPNDCILYDHVKFLDNYLLQVYEGKIRKLMVWMPPRHGKSNLTTKYFTAWWLKKRPRDNVIISTYGFEFASEWGEKSREVYKAFGLGVPLGKRQANANWRTARGGGVICAGVDGGITGRGGNLFVLDDPIKNAIEAKSELQRNNAKEFYQSTARTRLEPSVESGLPGAIIVIQTRWHEDDLSGWLLETEGEYHPTKNPNGWVVVRLPALATEDDPLGRPVGEALCPERYPREELLGIQATSDAYWWNCMYQQNPIPAEGSVIPVMQFPTYTTVEVSGELYYRLEGVLVKVDDCYRFTTLDLAATEKSYSDWSVGTTFDMVPASAFVDGLRRVILVDVKRQRLETTKHLDFALDFLNAGSRFVGVEKKTYGLNLVQSGKRQGLPIRPIEADADKVARAMELIDLMTRVYLPNDSEAREWKPDLVAELAAFPNGKHDDQVDAFVYGVRVLAQHNQYIRKRDEQRKPLPDPASERAARMLERMSKRKRDRRHPILGRL